MRVGRLEGDIAALIQVLGPSLLTSWGALSAAKVIDETAGGRRFRCKSAYAS